MNEEERRIWQVEWDRIQKQKIVKAWEDWSSSLNRYLVLCGLSAVSLVERSSEDVEPNHTIGGDS